MITATYNEQLITSAAVKARFGGVSAMWIYRRLATDPTFPKPIYIGRRRYWRLGDLVAWERQLIAASAGATT